MKILIKHTLNLDAEAVQTLAGYARSQGCCALGENPTDRVLIQRLFDGAVNDGVITRAQDWAAARKKTPRHPPCPECGDTTLVCEHRCQKCDRIVRVGTCTNGYCEECCATLCDEDGLLKPTK